jgi:hypothetical protein
MPGIMQMIMSMAEKQKVQQYIIEKDYALSYLLAAINGTDGLRQNLVLKGGTALKSRPAHGQETGAIKLKT